MNEEYFVIHGIPAILCGDSRENLFLYIHGKMGCMARGRIMKEEQHGL